jgi:hypothetical protein
MAHFLRKANMKLAALLWSAWLGMTATSQAVEPAISIAIAAPRTDMDATDGARHQIIAFDKHSHFSAVLTNLSDQPQRIIRGGSSADHTLRFECSDAAGKKWKARRVEQEYSKNTLRWETLGPHECLVMEVEFANPDQWDGFPKPLPYGQSQTVTMQAVFDVDPSAVPPDKKLWTGQVESAQANYEFDWRMSGPTRGIGIVAEPGKPFGQVEVNLQNHGPDENQTLDRLTVISNGQELKIPAGALTDINCPMAPTLNVSVEPDSDGHDVLYISFELGKPNSTNYQPDYVGLHSAPRRMYFGFQNGAFLKRFTVERVSQIVDVWKP